MVKFVVALLIGLSLGIYVGLNRFDNLAPIRPPAGPPVAMTKPSAAKMPEHNVPYLFFKPGEMWVGISVPFKPRPGTYLPVWFRVNPEKELAPDDGPKDGPNTWRNVKTKSGGWRTIAVPW